MADLQDVAQVSTNLTLELSNVSNALTAQGISSAVFKFDGNPKNYREWIKSIEKYATLINVPEARKKLIAYQSSGNAVSGFIHRYMQANPANTCGQLKEQLAVRFSDVTDPQMALSMLKTHLFPSLARPPLHDHPQYTVLITERTSKAYII